MSVDDVLDHLLPEGWRDADRDVERVGAVAEHPRRGWTSRASSAAAPRLRFDAEAFGRLTETDRPLPRHRPLPRRAERSIIVLWIAVQHGVAAGLRFDPYPLQFLTLILSLQAAYSAPLILLAQNRQDDRDRVNLEADREEARESKADLEYLAREIAAIRMALGEVATRDFLRSELARAEAARESQRRDPEADGAPARPSTASSARRRRSPSADGEPQQGRDQRRRDHDDQERRAAPHRDRPGREPGQPRAVEHDAPPVGHRLDDHERGQQRDRQQLDERAHPRMVEHPGRDEVAGRA